MTTYQFEVAAKNAVIDFAKETLAINLSIEDVDVVWMTHVLGYKKCLLMSHYTPYYYEITYDKVKDSMYFDAYEKRVNKVIKNFKITVDNPMEDDLK